MEASATRTWSPERRTPGTAAPVVSASAWALAALGGSVCVALLILSAASWDSHFASAIATSTVVVALIGFFMATRPSLTHLTFIFMAEALIYQVVEPWLLVTGGAAVNGGEFFTGNYPLLTLGNKYLILGLICYGFGTALAAVKRKATPRRELLKLSDITSVTTILLVLAGLSWLIIFVRAGLPKEALLLIRSPKITRNQDFVAGGWVYLLSISLSTNIAMLAYALRHPRKSLLSPSMFGILLCVLLFNGIRGSRLVFAMAPLGVLVLKQLMALRDPTKQRPTLGMFGIGIATFVLLLFALVYTEYRSLASENAVVSSIDWRQTLPQDAGTLTDTAVTYYMVLERVPQYYDYWHGRGFLFPVLSMIPRFMFPNKNEVTLGYRQFVEQFFGYDEWGFGKSATGYDLPAEAFLNLGVFGIAIVFLMLGWLNETLAARAHSQYATNFFSVFYVYYLCYVIPEIWKGGVVGGIGFLQVPLAVFFVVSLLASSVRPLRPGSKFAPASGGLAPSAPEGPPL